MAFIQAPGMCGPLKTCTGSCYAMSRDVGSVLTKLFDYGTRVNSMKSVRTKLKVIFSGTSYIPI